MSPAPGKNVSTLISNMGIFEKNGGEFELTGYFMNQEPNKENTIQRIADHCGWELKVSRQIEKVPEPTEEELTLLRCLDPEGVFIA